MHNVFTFSSNKLNHWEKTHSSVCGYFLRLSVSSIIKSRHGLCRVDAILTVLLEGENQTSKVLSPLS